MALIQSDQYDLELLELVNNERAQAGVDPLTLVEELDTAADTKSQNQAQAGIMSHTDPITGDNPGAGLEKAGYQGNTWGENVAWNQPTPEAVMEDWMNSSGHRANILNENFTEVGFGYVEGYWTQSFGAGNPNSSTYVPQTDSSSVASSNPTPEVPDDEQPTPEIPSGEQPIGEVPGNEPPIGELPSGDPPTSEDSPGGEQPSGDATTQEAIQEAIDDFIESVKNGNDIETARDELTNAIDDIISDLDDGETTPGDGSGQKTFVVESGVTSVSLDPSVLETAGLTLGETADTVEANIEGFPEGQPAVGFEIQPETDFSFTQENSFTPVAGTIEHSGSLTVNGVGTVGNFSVGYDPSRDTDTTSGFFVADTLDTQAILFDLSDPQAVNFDGENLEIADSDLLVSSEFASVLGNESLAGTDIGDVRIDAIGQLQDLANTNANTDVVA